ncbi:uncharacterized protein METZ01_LOCUS217574, partial [marine metagenome]
AKNNPRPPGRAARRSLSKNGTKRVYPGN